jgi:hypothetical protein
MNMFSFLHCHVNEFVDPKILLFSHCCRQPECYPNGAKRLFMNASETAIDQRETVELFLVPILAAKRQADSRRRERYEPRRQSTAGHPVRK